jgi:FlaA1/EpsC-like NDP-sugar epimerase
MFVRFGNVFGSRGSVFPLFMDQIRTGGPVTVTDPRMHRYFMTIAEACSLVLKTGGIGQNGFSYLLDMGEPLRVVDIAEQLIRFSGYEVDKDIKIEFIGARQGERLDEPLWTAQENPQRTEHEKILQLQSASTDFDTKGLISQLYPICFLDKDNPQAFRNKDLLLKVLRPILYKTDDEKK